MFERASNILEEALREQRPIVAYRNPGEECLTVIRQNSNRLNQTINLSGRGFVFAPFTPGEPAILLTPDTVNQIELRGIEPPEVKNVPELREKEEAREHYIRMIAKARRSIRQGTLRKVVLSRKIEVQVQTKAVRCFEAILQWYPAAFCYFWYHPRVGQWLGASPELLFSLDGEDFNTVSLAGTQVFSTNPKPVWGPKEREEQAMVTHYIEESLRNKHNSLTISPPETVRAGSLLHLRSQISGKLGEATLIDLIRALHPTPAVCGLPKAESLTFIRGVEGYDRRYYTGYLGPIRLDTDRQRARLFVNLRCMSLEAEKANIYVGGGITASSIPEAEWQETRDKARTMHRVLDNSAQ